jgi:hypothetical protein
MKSEKEKIKKMVEEIYKSQHLKKEIKPNEEDIKSLNRHKLVLKSFGYFFIFLYLLLFLKIEPITSFFNNIPMSDGFMAFLAFASFLTIYFAIVDMFQRLKNYSKKVDMFQKLKTLFKKIKDFISDDKPAFIFIFFIIFAYIYVNVDKRSYVEKCADYGLAHDPTTPFSKLPNLYLYNLSKETLKDKKKNDRYSLWFEYCEMEKQSNLIPFKKKWKGSIWKPEFPDNLP